MQALLLPTEETSSEIVGSAETIRGELNSQQKQCGAVEQV